MVENFCISGQLMSYIVMVCTSYDLLLPENVKRFMLLDVVLFLGSINRKLCIDNSMKLLVDSLLM